MPNDAALPDRRLITRVAIRNYKSIAACDVAPAQLSFLVGPNGSGKEHIASVAANLESRAPAVLHPAAFGVLIDSLQDAARHGRQVLVTSHSPDLLDDKDLPEDSILAVAARDGETNIGPLDRVGHETLREHFFTAGELLRMDQLYPDPDRPGLKPGKLHLFGPTH